MPELLSFSSRGERHVGVLHLPEEGRGRAEDGYVTVGAGLSVAAPTVVTAPGFAGVKEMLIPHYAQALARAGIACFSFDYAGFGGSGGARRQHLDPFAQAQAYRDALTAVAAHPAVDPTRLGVWGTSMAGGHTLRVAASDPRVRAAVALIPFIAHRAAPAPWLVARVVADAARRLTGRPGLDVPVSGDPGDQALMTTDGALDWLARVSADAPTYVNRVTVASLLPVARYDNSRAAAAAAARVPLRVVLAEEDSITPASQVRRALGRGPGSSGADVVAFPGSHFELFDEHLTATIDLTVEWFTRHLDYSRTG